MKQRCRDPQWSPLHAHPPHPPVRVLLTAILHIWQASNSDGRSESTCGKRLFSEFLNCVIHIYFRRVAAAMARGSAPEDGRPEGAWRYSRPEAHMVSPVIIPLILQPLRSEP